MNTIPSAQDFMDEILSLANEDDRVTMMRFFKTGKGQYGENDVFIGVKMSVINTLSKKYTQLSVTELEKMLIHPYHEFRAGAIYVMSRNCKTKTLSQAIRKEYYDLYLRQHSHINNWDLIDSGCIQIIGGYLLDKPRDILYKLVYSADLWERRTAIVSTLHFIRNSELEDTFKLSDILINDKQDLIHKASGWMLRCAGQKNKSRLVEYLEEKASKLPRTALRYAIEKFTPSEREYFMTLK